MRFEEGDRVRVKDLICDPGEDLGELQHYLGLEAEVLDVRSGPYPYKISNTPVGMCFAEEELELADVDDWKARLRLTPDGGD